jgi:hypothetical protein
MQARHLFCCQRLAKHRGTLTIVFVGVMKMSAVARAESDLRSGRRERREASSEKNEA